MGKGRVLRIYDTRAIFENLDNGNCLVVTQVKDGWSKDFQVCDRSQLADVSGQCQTIYLESIFGFYDLLSGTFVSLIVESEQFVETSNISIKKALKIIVVPLFRSGRILSSTKQVDEDKYLELLHLSFSQHSFFFSTTFDITHTQQRQALLTNRQLTDPLWARANSKYFWNREVVLDMIACQADDWIMPLMSAFIEFRPGCEVENDKFSMLFISRRSRMRQGCRFTKRGVDDLGFVANYVETEQIIIFPDGRVTSHIQIRGSIPLVWASPVSMKYDPAVVIEKDTSKSVENCEKHILDVINDCNDGSNTGFKILFVNLIDNKKDQGRLGVAFKDLIDQVNKRHTNPNITLTYIWFDFHKETSQKGKWANLAKLMNMVDEESISQGFFSKMANGTILSFQKSIFRTNCMDNLDRTNVVQSIFARRSMLMQLGKRELLSGGDVLTTPFKKLEGIYKTIWVNNANEMSFLYAGTGALKVDFTKTGKRTVKGMFDDGVNSCHRYYINNFTDGVKQDALDLMLGNYRPDAASPSPFVPRDGQEYLSSNITKCFIVMVLIFATTLQLLPPSTAGQIPPQEVEANSVVANGVTYTPNFTKHILISMGVTSLVLMYVMYSVMKKGSKIGERLVVHPLLMPENNLQGSK